MRILFASLLISLLTACATSGNTTRTIIPIDFAAMQYNSIANRYINQPTIAEYALKNSGSSWLSITMDAYGRDQFGNQNTVLVTFVRENTDSYISFIDKYLEWERTASADKDVFSKRIGKAKGQIFDMVFTFHSGNENTHYLTIGLWGSDHQFYSRDAAIQLRELLAQYKNDQLKSLNANEKYN